MRGLLLALLLAAAGASPQLRFDQQGLFKVVQFTDLHYGEDAGLDAQSDQVRAPILARACSHRMPTCISPVAPAALAQAPANNLLAPQVQATVLAAERPGLVAFSGDQVSGFAWDKLTPGWYAQHWRQLIAPAQAAGVPYASVLGEQALVARRLCLTLC